jgi:hypothetical protein
MVPSVWPARSPARSFELATVEVDDGSAVRLEIDRPARATRGTLLLLHGMCGSARSGYMLRTSRIALARGWTVARMNLRTCGGTELLSRTFYNAGQSGDVGRVLAYLAGNGHRRPLAAAGFSLGGNIVLLHAGRAAGECIADAVAAVNPPVDLDRCARAIERPRNLVYLYHFTSRLCRHHRRVLDRRGTPGPRARLSRQRTVRAFDDAFTAPDAGYSGADDYYATCSAAQVLGRVSRPALVISAQDDPFIPVEIFRPHHGAGNVRFAHPAAGGHCGYVGRGVPRYWAGGAVVRFLEDASGGAGGARQA